MARLTEKVILQEYAQGKRENSFYQEQEFGEKINGDYIFNHLNSATVYYNDAVEGCLKAEETLFLR